jgi:hypothetical protein
VDRKFGKKRLASKTERSHIIVKKQHLKEIGNSIEEALLFKKF